MATIENVFTVQGRDNREYYIERVHGNEDNYVKQFYFKIDDELHEIPERVFNFNRARNDVKFSLVHKI